MNTLVKQSKIAFSEKSSCTSGFLCLQYVPARGHGSAGRAPPCQGGGRGFEPRCPLHDHPGRHSSFAGPVCIKARWPSGKAEACKAFTTGSNPVLASRNTESHLAVAFLHPRAHLRASCAEPRPGIRRDPGYEVPDVLAGRIHAQIVAFLPPPGGPGMQVVVS